MFAANNINVHYFDYSSFPTYVQLYGEFEHGVSILDLIFNKGAESIKHLNNNKDLNTIVNTELQTLMNIYKTPNIFELFKTLNTILNVAINAAVALS